MKSVLAILMFATTILASPAWADFIDGYRLAKWAQEVKKFRSGTLDSGETYHVDSNSTQVAIFMGFVSGVYDSIDGPRCASENLTGGQIFDVVIKYLEEHPEQHHLSGSGLVAGSVQEAFPCD
ncbi:MAG: hypothetical protein JSW48_07125 [Betaproteobacteria bacterium]|nr:MAG: hypothetical protein JSW48_07125 [Betaproteobacteria bacterium]